MTDPKDPSNMKLNDKYKLKGAQQMSLEQYEAMNIKRRKDAAKMRIPKPIQYIMGTPLMLIFIAGLFFIPYILYLIITSPSAPPPTDDPVEESSIYKK